MKHDVAHKLHIVVDVELRTSLPEDVLIVGGANILDKVGPECFGIRLQVLETIYNHIGGLALRTSMD